MNCSVLRDVTIGNSMIRIGERAFVGANTLESLLIPSSVTSIGADLCYGCPLKKVIIGNGVTELNAWDGNYQGDPYNSDRYRWGVFENCNNLEDVALGNAVVSFGTDTFAATNLSSLVIPSKVTDIKIEPIPPMAEDYLFLGWYHETSCQNQWDFLNDKVTADTTIYDLIGVQLTLKYALKIISSF
ncbi:MAG: leucine-rich repeat protein [Lachnospiraceae bacterium]|nr:leucine-rich repeat protein [Lachnospiraceae bacterium]